MKTIHASTTAPRKIGQLLLLTGGFVLLLSAAGCAQQSDQPLTPWQQQYYKKQADYQALGDARRNDDHSCHTKKCM